MTHLAPEAGGPSSPPTGARTGGRTGGRAAKRVVELAAASLPWAIRDRYREEWLHDLEHAGEAGVRPAGVAWGAVRTANTADRMQAPSLTHAILQARLRIDAAGVHASIAIMLAAFAFHGIPSPIVVVSASLLAGALLHSLALAVRLQLAAATLGGRLRFAGPVWLLGVVLGGVTVLTGATELETAWWSWMLPVGCCLASLLLSESRKPPKPDVRESLAPVARHRMLLVGSTIGGLTVALALLDALVIVPLLGGTTAPVGAVGILAGVMLLIIVASVLGAARWGRSSRAILAWSAAGSFVAAVAAYTSATAVAFDLPAASTPAAPLTVLLPLVGGALVHCTTATYRDLAPLPPASVPIPPGPWHVSSHDPAQKYLPGQAKGPGVEPGADRARGGT